MACIVEGIIGKQVNKREFEAAWERQKQTQKTRSSDANVARLEGELAESKKQYDALRRASAAHVPVGTTELHNKIADLERRIEDGGTTVEGLTAMLDNCMKGLTNAKNREAAEQYNVWVKERMP